MENKTKNIIMSLLFFAVVIALIVGGYIYTKDLSSKDSKTTIKKEEEIIDYRIDKDKDYIYFENEEIVSMDPELTYSDVVLNIEGADIINSKLKTEMDSIRKTIVKLDETNKDESKTILYDETEVYSAIERNYIIYKSKNYYSLVINDIDFNCYTDFLTKSLVSYTIDIKNGSILTDEEMLKKYNVTEDDIKEKVAARIDETQSADENIEVINKDETLNSLFDNCAFYINGEDLYLTFIVKSNFVNYNDNVKLN